MTTPSGSLEDCLTNYFSLLELIGLKWKCLTAKAEQSSSSAGNRDLEQDPVIKAYGQCLNEGILCTWRRKPPNDASSEPPTIRLNCARELWIFWYPHEEPKVPELLTSFAELVATDDAVEDEGFDKKLNYDTRVLLFDALHKRIDRAFLQDGIIRFGRYFVRPLDISSGDVVSLIPQYVTAFELPLFVQGDNQVCTAPIVQAQRTIFRLSKFHLKCKEPQPVILAPWSMRALLLPNQPLDTSLSPTKPERSTGLSSGLIPSLPSTAGLGFPTSSSTLFESPVKPTNPADMARLSEAQALAAQAWNDWKKCGALPVDDVDDSLLANISSSDVPKMVLVEVDGLQMYYPSCLVGVLAEEMLPRSAYQGENASEGCKSDDAMEEEEQPAEALSADAKRKEVYVPDDVRHCKKSFAGVRAARRSFEDGCLSVLVSSSSLRRNDSVTGDLTSNGLTTPSMEEDTRWNFFDYYRREFCYCKTCSNGTIPVNNGSPAPEPKRVPEPFHRSPVPKETSTSEHPSVFAKEMASLKIREKDADVPLWARGLSRRDFICGKMEMDNSTDPDMLKFLHSQRPSTSAEPQPRCFSPFTPITCITPEPDPVENGDLQSRLKAFEYAYNPLKRDSVSPESYHVTSPRPKPIGVPADRSIPGLRRSSDDAEMDATAQPSTSGESSILKSLLEDDLLAGSPQENKPDKNVLGLRRTRARTIRKKRRPRLDRPRRRSGWPTVADLDALYQTVKDNEESGPFVVTDCFPMESSETSLGVRDHSMNDTFRAVFQRLEMPSSSTRQTADDVALKADGTVASTSQADAEPMQTDDQASSSTAVTPPALCNLEDSSELQQLLSDDGSRPTTTPAGSESQATNNINNASFGLTSNRTATPVDQMMAQSTMVPSVGSDNGMHILSPPASNERVDPSGAYCPPNAALIAFGSQLVNGSHDFNSLNIIYPTPPTPMQQFSPQNAVLNAHLLAEAQQQRAQDGQQPSTSANSSQGRQFLKCDSAEDTTPMSADYFRDLPQSPMYDGTTACEMPNSVSFSGNLFAKGVELDQQVAEAESLKVALGSRSKRSRISKPPSYAASKSSLSRDVASGPEPTTNGVPATTAPGAGMQHNGQYAGANDMSPMAPFMASGGNPMGALGPHGGLPNGVPGTPNAMLAQQQRIAWMRAQMRGMTPQQQQMFMQQQHQQMIPFGAGGGSGPMTPLGGQQPFRMPFDQQQQAMMGRGMQQQMQIGGMQHHPMQRMNSFDGGMGGPNASSMGPMGGMGSPLHSSSPFMSPGAPGGGRQSLPPAHGSPFGSPAPNPMYNNADQMGQGGRPVMLHHQASSGSLLGGMSMDFSQPSTSMTPVGAGPTFFGMTPEKATLAPLKTMVHARSFVAAVLLQDTVLDLHYDTVFDACPICSCNVNIRQWELGVYLRTPSDLQVADHIRQQQQQNKTVFADYWNGFMTPPNEMHNQRCNCGFSIVRHRYLCAMPSGLFTDDVREACGFSPSYPPSKVPRLTWFKPPTTATSTDADFMDLLRQLCVTRDVAAIIENGYNLGALPDSLEKPKPLGSDITENSEYLLLRVDAEEVESAMRSVLDVAGTSAAKDVMRPSKTDGKPVLHPWGVQIANTVREPKEAEHIALLREVHPLLEDTMKKVRGVQNVQNIVEGPLSWRSLHRKTMKALAQQQEGDSEAGPGPEPIPNVIVSTDKDSIHTNPQLVHMWEKLSFGPYDQPKDVLYLAVVPDNYVVVEKCKVFLEELTSAYERCRFGRHVKVMTKDSPQDAIIRVHHRSNATSNGSLGTFLGEFDEKHIKDRKVLMSRLKGFTDNFANDLSAFLKANDSVFERRGYFEAFYRERLQQTHTSLATASDANSMPPPAVPIQSPSSVLSSASGPASSNAFLQPPVAQLASPSAQQSPAAAPSSIPPASGMEALTPESQAGGTPNPQQPLATAEQQAQKMVSDEATIEKLVDEYMAEDSGAALPHVVVIYLVNPFSFGSDAHHQLFARVATVALMRAFNTFLYQLEPHRRPLVQLEIVNLQTLYDYSAFISDPLREDRQTLEPTDYCVREGMSAHDALRRIAFSVYSQSRLLLPEAVRGILAKSMTRFGPASAVGDILDAIKRKATSSMVFKVPSSPYVLAPNRCTPGSKLMGVAPGGNNKIQLANPDERVLFVSYCLVGEDWLCAAATDESGHLLDTVLINTLFDKDKRNYKHKNRSQVFDAVHRLWQFVQSLLVLETKNWRVVVGRLGKIGHGEFRAWTQIMSKKSLRTFNNSLKNKDKDATAPSTSSCKTCSLMPGCQETPAILSACLVSTEAEPNLRVFASSLSQSDASSTPKNAKSKPPQSMLDDTSITHIMVFPTRSDLSLDPQYGHGAGTDAGAGDDGFDFLNFGLGGDAIEGDEDQLVNDEMFKEGLLGSDNAIDNQPLASGFYISTSPALDLPDWFWSVCPSAKRRLPVHLKSSLHINCQSEHNEDLMSKDTGAEGSPKHPLEASATDEVLKYVLETYNALSWLNVDLVTGARHSCLPVHVQAMLRLYRSLTTIFS